MNEQALNALRTALELLKQERARVEEQLQYLERLIPDAKGAAAAAPVKRGPGRPKGSGTKQKAAAAAAPAQEAGKQPGGRKKPHWSQEARSAAKERMKKYWAERRKAKAAAAAQAAG